ncbi:MAG: TM2 domain-containing protein [Clostridia bacterium]|nr:TM2 domain-containing protein [Clostridia bacterium]
MSKCPRCASEYSSNDKKCPRCGLEVRQMKKFLASQGADLNEETKLEKSTEVSVNLNQDETKPKAEKPKSERQLKREQKLAEKKAKKAEKQKAKEELFNEQTDFSKFARNTEENIEARKNYDGSFKQRRKFAKEKNQNPQFNLDENGEFDIDTSDVEIVGEENAKLIEEQKQREYSIRKARGDYKEPKIAWWDLYKLADRAMARRKIKKEVNKAAVQKPPFVKKAKLLILCIFLGWVGAHDFYARNHKRGFVSLITAILSFGLYALSSTWVWIQSAQLWLIGFPGFINLFMWISDIFSIIFNKYKFRIQKENFIFKLNVQTRAKLGKKYISEEYYRKPWWFKFKVWCSEQKEASQERKKARKLRAIEIEKAKLEKEKELKKQLADEAKAEEFQDELKQKEKFEAAQAVDKKLIKEIDTFGNSSNEEKKVSGGSQKNKVKKTFKSKKKK